MPGGADLIERFGKYHPTVTITKVEKDGIWMEVRLSYIFSSNHIEGIDTTGWASSQAPVPRRGK